MKKRLVKMLIAMYFAVCMLPAVKDFNSEMLVAPCGAIFENVDELE